MAGLAAAVFASTAVMAATLAGTGAPAAGGGDIVATRVDADQRMTVPVSIGAQGPWRFLVDTGAQNTVISADLAQRLALSARGQASLVGVAGVRRVDTVTLDGLGLGRRSFSGLVAPLLDRQDIGADGILGLDSLQDQRVLLDFVHDAIAIDDADRASTRGFDIVVRARRQSGQLIVTSARIDGVPVDVVLDTGSGVTIGNRALQRALHRRVAPRQAMLESVTGQHTLADIGLADELALGPLAIRNVVIAYADAPPFARLKLDRKPALLLGMRELRGFKRVAIDFSTRKVLFDVPDTARADVLSLEMPR